MKLAVFGASGRTGRLVVAQALSVGHEVTAFVRDPARLALVHERLRIVTGAVQDPVRVAEAVRGTDAVVSTIGPVRGEPAGIMVTAATNIVAAMRAQGVRRLVYMTGAGVVQPQDPPALAPRIMLPLMRLLAREVLEDAERGVAAVSNSGLEWVIVRAPRLSDAPARGRYRHGYIKPTLHALSRGDVAAFILQQLGDDTYLHQMPIISY